MKIIFEFLKRESKGGPLFSFDLRNNKKIQQDQDGSFESATRVTERNKSFLFLPKKHLPMLFRYVVGMFIMKFNLNLGELTILAEDLVQSLQKIPLNYFTWESRVGSNEVATNDVC